MKHSETFNFFTPDANGYVPDLSLRNTIWRHSGNGKRYCLTDFTWNGADDTWWLAMLPIDNEDAPMVVRPLEHLTGNRENGEQRYIEIKQLGDYNGS